MSSSRGGRPGLGVAATLAAALLLMGAAVLALGRPDVGLAGDFFTSSRPGYAGALAAAQLLVWGLVTILVVAQLATALRRSTGIGADMRGRRVKSELVLLIGLLVFVGGALRHQAQVASLCCGDIERADRLVR